METANLVTHLGGKMMEHKEAELQPQSRAYTVGEIAAILHIGWSSAYTPVQKGYLKSVRTGAAIRISRKPFDGWPDQLDLQLALKSRNRTAMKECGGASAKRS